MFHPRVLFRTLVPILALTLLMLTATPAAAQSTRGTTVWSATLTVDSGNTDILGGDADIATQGCSDYLENFDNCNGVGLTNVTFAYANTNYVVKELLLYQPNVPTLSNLILQLDVAVPDYRGDLGLYIGDTLFAAEDASPQHSTRNPDGLSRTSLVWLTIPTTTLTWVDDQTVTVKLVDRRRIGREPATPTLTGATASGTELSFTIGCVSGVKGNVVTDYTVWAKNTSDQSNTFEDFLSDGCGKTVTMNVSSSTAEYTVQVRARAILGSRSAWSDPVTISRMQVRMQVQGGGTSDPGSTDELTASFEQVPDEHDGKAQFSFLVRLSETVGRFSKSPRAESFEVTRGRVQSVEQVDAGLWRVQVKPNSWRRVGVTLAGGKDCDDPGAVCTRDIRPLANTMSAFIPGPPGLSVAPRDGKRAIREGQPLVFVVTLTRAVTGTVTVDYATADETATAGADYTAASGTLTFAPGETEKTVQVGTLPDLSDEGQEIFRLNLSNASGAGIRDGRAAGRIKD